MTAEQQPGAAESRDTYAWRERAVRVLASAALAGSLASLAGCAPSENKHQPSPDTGRHAPASAEYSTGANPGFYNDVAEAKASASGPSMVDKLDVLGHQPVAEWLPTDSAEAVSAVQDALVASHKDGSIPVFVSYAIPDRDLGGPSSGGLDASEYRAYTAAVSRAIGNKPAIMVVEPDALAQLPDMASDSQRDERVGLLADAVDTYYGNQRTAVYLDAGNSSWRSAGETASLLGEVAQKTRDGIQGISLNVSNFQSTPASEAYAEAVQTSYGHTLYTLIDTSRNGNPQAAREADAGDYCNPQGQRLGQADALFDARAAVEEAYIKTPGESDGAGGNCDSTVPAGQFDAGLLFEQLG